MQGSAPGCRSLVVLCVPWSICWATEMQEAGLDGLLQRGELVLQCSSRPHYSPLPCSFLKQVGGGGTQVYGWLSICKSGRRRNLGGQTDTGTPSNCPPSQLSQWVLPWSKTFGDWKSQQGWLLAPRPFDALWGKKNKIVTLFIRSGGPCLTLPSVHFKKLKKTST